MQTVDPKRAVTQITQRLSLRKPQAEALRRLDDIVDLIAPSKDTDVEAAREAVRQVYGPMPDARFEEFERDFPSICFALATGVGKTRLMGAFISYLYMIGKSRNFFVLAPNLTIYEKLLADFQPTSPKYVFRGIEAFAHQAPLIVNAENYEEGRGVRGTDLFGREGAIINIFNISKINSEVRGGNSPRIKRLQEYIGDSYFAYLSGLDDLVLLMDEAHRYRASAGAKAIAELRPILGLEVTATPKSVGARSAELGTSSIGTSCRTRWRTATSRSPPSARAPISTRNRSMRRRWSGSSSKTASITTSMCGLHWKPTPCSTRPMWCARSCWS